jgi:hypothetical protein
MAATSIEPAAPQNRMEWSNRKFGITGMSLEALATIIFCGLLVTEKVTSNKTVAIFLLGLSGRLLLLAGLVTLIGMFIDKKPALAVITMILTFPILILMAGLQGIW